MEKETVWLNQAQMAELFGRDVKTIRKHINNALKEELKDEMVVANFASTTKHGAIEGKTQTRDIRYYNLDMVLSVGYRVKSNKGVAFRKWATKVLKDYMIKGYAVNQKRLEYLEKKVKLIDIAGRIDRELKGEEVVATDLRAGATMVIAGLIAEGKTVINNADHILRGYEGIVEKLTNVGAKLEIKDVEDK